ncbi:unnamed protein product [Parascedosporium putredinis]|uniref:TAP42-like protein n=1 Tax=Parascedosporium putredinis TaxID=1442378 RepID=A0A9P1M6Y7_9PEZI|nr:unnamed protein product [Parascedosporium putredinis]CAI7987822.1 unnamed protein product [Parascedosporium putredinis]
MAEDEPPQSLRSLFEQAEETQTTLASMHDFRSEQYQETLAAAIKSYEECLRLVVELSIFSPNESVEDIATSSLPYLLINYHLAQLVQRFRPSSQQIDSIQFEKQRPLTSRSSGSSTGDEELVRQVYLTNIEFHVHMAFQDLESLNKELDMLRQAPPNPRPQQMVPNDARHRAPGQNNDSYSERLDAPLTSLLGTRQDLKKGVFRSGHNLPTMSIDDFQRPEPDEDNIEKADAETYKAREWDEFTEANPKGSGNTLNRG